MGRWAAWGLNSNQIKIAAFGAMTIDHAVWLCFPGLQTQWYVLLLHALGRITAPVMWFFLAEGFHYTTNIEGYVKRLFAFALISHFAYGFAFGIPWMPLSTGVFNQTSVMWPLAWSVVLMAIMGRQDIGKGWKIAAIVGICLMAFPADWSSVAVMCPYFLYLHRGNFRRQAWQLLLWSAQYALVYYFVLDKQYGLLQMCTLLSLPLLAAYNGERGRMRGMQWFFYIFYPAHLCVIGILRLLWYGDVSLIF